MRTFFSYGPVNPKLHYSVPRTELIDHALDALIGDPVSGGQYLTVWAPRQCGKTWIMGEVLGRLWNEPEYVWTDAVKLNIQHLEGLSDLDEVAMALGKELASALDRDLDIPQTMQDFDKLFRPDVLEKPLILMIDEFDALAGEAIAGVTRVLRNIYMQRQEATRHPSATMPYMLHSVALIGVRSVLGIDNKSGSPFNIQLSLNIPNLSKDEVDLLFEQYMDESDQRLAAEVIDRIYYEFNGQPGLTSWFGELLTTTFNEQPEAAIDMQAFERAYREALYVVPNANIINIVSKARQEPYTQTVLDLFETSNKPQFAFDDPQIGFLYLNGVVDIGRQDEDLNVRFANPFIQRRLFNALSLDYSAGGGRLHDPLDDLSDTITDTELNIRKLLKRYEAYLDREREHVLRNAPRRKSDLRVYEATFHFHIYQYLYKFFRNKQGQIIPEFPTGNGKIDLIIRYAGQLYGLELKSYSDQFEHKASLTQAARYANQLGLSTIWLVSFIEAIDEENRLRLETTYHDTVTNVSVEPLFIQTAIQSTD